MDIIDDPMLALMARFVIDDIENLNLSEEEFLQHQILEIKNNIEHAPKEQRQQLALAWIREHAEKYRKDWRRRTISKMVLEKRCADCPLIHDGSMSHCAIHGRWVILINEYMADKISSETYIKETLDLLTQHKESLKISRIASKMQHS